MDPDLPLIEIAGEDDSLLLTSPLGAASTTATVSTDDFFACSPLLPPRSRPTEVVNVDRAKEKESMNSSSNVNKIEENRFGLPPQKMKRKKKGGGGGGFNLRKSLAWDRAFFEEEGVLNSEELSMITGSGSLSVIHEESDSTYLQDLEENVFKAVPGSTPKKDRITGGSPLSKHGSPARDNAVSGSAGRQKALSARDGSKSGSKRSGCPRPMVSSSLKRPANVNTMKSATKEPKVSKLPVPKPIPLALSKTSKNVMVCANDKNRSQIANPVNLNRSKAGSSNEKVGSLRKSSTAKTITRPARRNVAGCVKSSPIKTQCPPVTESNNGSEGIKKQTSFTSICQTSYDRDDRSRKIAVPVELTSKQALTSASNASYCHDDRLNIVSVPRMHTGPNIPNTQLQTSKPSGLRLPSPSLGFFNQTKATSLPDPSLSSSQSCKILNERKTGPVNPIRQLKPPSLRKTANANNAGTVTDNSNVQCSISFPYAITQATMDKVHSDLQMSLVQAELPSNAKGYIVGDHRKLNSTLVPPTPQAEPNISGKLSYMEDVKFPRHDKILVDQGSSFAFPPRNTQIQGNRFEKVANARAEVPIGSAAGNKKFDASSFSRCEDQAKDDCSKLNTRGRHLHVDDAQMTASDRKLDKVNDVTPNTSAPDNWQLVKTDSGSEEQDLLNPCYIGEQVYQDDISDLNECVLNDIDVLSGKPPHNNVVPFFKLKEPEKSGASTVESAVSRNPHVLTTVMVDCSSDDVEMVDSSNVLNTVSISGEVDNHNLDTQFKNDISVHRQDFMGLHNADEEERRDTLTAQDIKTTSVESGINLKVQIETLSVKDTVQQKDFGNGSHFSIESSCNAPHLLQPEGDIISFYQDTSMVHSKFIVDQINCTEEESNVPSGDFDDGKHSAEQDKQVVSSSDAAARILNWHIVDHNLLFEGRKSVEECQKYKTTNLEDISLKVNLCDPSGLHITHTQLNHEKLEDENLEVHEGVNVIKEPLPGSPGNQSSTANCRHSVDCNNAHDVSTSPESQHPNTVAVEVSQEFKPRSNLNGILDSDNTSCSGYRETDELVLGRYDACGCEPMCSNACREVTSAICDDRPDLQGEVDYAQLDFAVNGSSLIEQLPGNVHGDKNSRDTNRLYDQAASVESDSSSKISTEEDSVQTLSCNSLEMKSMTSLISDQTSPSGSILQDKEVTLLRSNSLAEDADDISLNNHTLDDEVQQNLDDTGDLPEAKDAEKELKNSRSGRKQPALVVKPPSDAVPFSDEWLAAIEAAGEEILTKKGGAVQNSPPNKSPPQLGPYSPVKRKQNQVIGPFDCTKHNNPPGL